MLLGARQFFERRGAPTPPLPYDAEVEYLESTGTQVIDLGFKGTDSISFDIHMYRPSDSTQIAFGANSGWGKNMCYVVTGNGLFYWMYGKSVGSTHVTVSPNAVGELRISATGNTFALQNISTQKIYAKVSAGTTPFSTDWNLCLFGGNENGTYGHCQAGTRIYSAEISDGDNHVDLIPVRKDGVGYMYDRVSGALFGNGGTGAFTIGPDK